jgi:hypothetical protein
MDGVGTAEFTTGGTGEGVGGLGGVIIDGTAIVGLSGVGSELALMRENIASNGACDCLGGLGFLGETGTV